MLQTKKQGELLKTDLNEMIKLYDLPDKEFRIPGIQMLTEMKRVINA